MSDHGDADSPESKLLGDRIDKVPGLVRAANPETWLMPDCPPVLFQHAPADPVVPVQMSVHFVVKINAVAGAGRARGCTSSKGQGTPVRSSTSRTLSARQ